jgi:multicomponent Na+:H+ antiporter subunit G
VITILLLAGVFFFAVAVIGILRLPDFYTRLHAASKCDTLGLMLILLAIILYTLQQDLSFGNILVSLKLLAILGFVFVASPTAANAITESALITASSPGKRGINFHDLATGSADTGTGTDLCRCHHYGPRPAGGRCHLRRLQLFDVPALGRNGGR